MECLWCTGLFNTATIFIAIFWRRFCYSMQLPEDVRIHILILLILSISRKGIQACSDIAGVCAVKKGEIVGCFQAVLILHVLNFGVVGLGGSPGGVIMQSLEWLYVPGASFA
jgi:hypothetical protein